jgi:hypothetical protein
MTTPTGGNLLRTWRGTRSQGVIAEALRVKQSYVSLLEADGRCPDLALALVIQAVSEGDVPATAWGYSEEEVARVLAAGAFGPSGGVPPNATATAIDGTPALRSERVRESKTARRGRPAAA